MKVARRMPVAALLVLSALELSACGVPELQQRRVLDSMIGQSEIDVLRKFGVPTRSYQAQGHDFLAYIDNRTEYSPGSVGWGWGWGGYGYGYDWGWGGPWGGYGGFPPTYYNTSCQTTFELVGGRVTAWTMRGDGC